MTTRHNASRLAVIDPVAAAEPASKQYVDTHAGSGTATGGRYSTAIGDGTSTNIVVTHGLNTRDVEISLYDASNYEEVNCDKFRTSVNTVTLGFAVAPAANSLIAVITAGGTGPLVVDADVSTVSNLEVDNFKASAILLASEVAGLNSDTVLPTGAAVSTALTGKQDADADLAAVAALTPTNDDVLQRKAGAWTNRTPAQLKADLAITQGDVSGLTAALGGKQASSTDLTAIAALTPTNDDVLQRKAGAWTNRTPAQLKTDLALQQSDISGLTTALSGKVDKSTLTTKGDLYVATGASTVTRLGVGTDGQALVADSTQTAGVKWGTVSGGGGGTGDASTNTSVSVDGEAVLFSGTGGKTLKRSTLTGIIKQTSGVSAAAVAGTDYVAPGGALGTPSSGTLTNCGGLPLTGLFGSTVIGRSVLSATDAATVRALIGNNLYYDVASAPYSITPATTNPEVGIQQALLDAAANGVPEVIVSTPGTYTVDLHVIPGQTYYAAAIYAVSNVKLHLKPGVIIKLKNSATLPGTASAAHIIGGDTATTKTGWAVVGEGIVDGNAANQSVPTILAGTALVACQSSYVSGIKVKGVYGTASSGTGETLHFEATKCANVHFYGCEADGSPSSNTATGFSSNFSYGVTWTDCVGHDMGHGMGFTNWMSASLQYSNCRAYKNTAASGFNAERSEGITYHGCIAGARSPFIEGGTSENPFFPSGQTALGNLVGFSIQGCTDVRGDIVSTQNGTNLSVYTSNPGSGLSALVNNRVVITGDCRVATTTEVYVEKASTGGTDQTEVKIDVLSGGASVADSFYCYAKQPLVNIDTGSSGIRYAFLGVSGAYVARWISAKVTGPISGGSVMGLTPDGQLHTSGRKENRRAVTANATITLQDYIIAVTDTSAARTITLPSAATAGAGATYRVKDDSGGAATNNITIARAGTDLIEGATSKVISTNYGWVTLVSTGTAWALVDSYYTDTLTGKRITKRVGTVASSATPTINTDTVDVFAITALATAITSMTTNLSGTPTDFQTLHIRIKDNGSAQTIAWGTSFQSSGVATLPTTTVAGKTIRVSLEWDAVVSKWVCLAVDAVGY